MLSGSGADGADVAGDSHSASAGDDESGQAARSVEGAAVGCTVGLTGTVQRISMCR